VSALPLDKAALSRSFSAAAPDYDAWAQAQDAIAGALVMRLPGEFDPSRIVDLGCGTGLLTGRLLERFPSANLLGVDLAPGMIEACRRRFAGIARARFLASDVEKMASRPEEFDLVALSCAAQWFVEPEETLGRWREALTPGGLLAGAFLLDGSFGEFERAHHEAVGCAFDGLTLPDEAKVLRLCTAAGLSALRTEAAAVVGEYASAREALKSFRKIGAVFRGQPGRAPLGVGLARRLLAAYELRSARPVAVTYRVLYVLARSGP